MFWFKSQKKLKIHCCYCAKVMRITRNTENCVHCGAEIPDRCKDFENAIPFFVPLMGWSSVGKTVWLLAVIRRLRELGHSVWNGFSPIPANKATLESFRNAEEMIRTRQIPAPTRPEAKEQLRPQVMILHPMPRWGDRTFVMRDCPGENFEDFDIHDDQVQFLRQTQIAFCMISLSDLWSATNKRKSMEEILHGYINTLGKDCNLRSQRRKFVVILSKGDEMANEMPPHLFHYLINDPVTTLAAKQEHHDWDETGMAKYMEELSRVSDEIRAWIATRPDGTQFLNLAQAYKMDLRFTITSSLGCPAPEGRLSGEWTPYRVLDPLFWALDFHSA